ncbi:MAG: alpha/beta hydrolase fold domain-containing protein, partial [Gammaproteobacteria bacterium]|nr:alpha/beta hydrolase fold domain-containing protein [Gammaproteobacteria bacterium]NIT04667.1 alpha/beta hydrolase fold domain-containing protein [Gammaproteobacteria bacterium]
MITLAYILSGLSLLMSVLFLIQTKNPLGWIVLIPKLTPGALSPYWAIMGAVGAVIGWVYQGLWAIPMGILGAGMMIWYVWRCTRDHNGFEKAFGAGWSDQIPPEQAKHMVQKRWRWFLKMKASPEPIWERDIPFWTIPGTDQQLLCDIWRPANGDVSGLAFVYFHGSGWYLSDKDFGTRPFFRHLVAQGHTVMDVAYRLCPEVDIYGMIGDVKRAIAWMKANASRYGVNPEKIVLGGGSAGGHLALLAGYTPGHPELTPEDVKGADLSVCGVISYYGPTDLLAAYQHENQQAFVDFPPVHIGEKFNFTNRFRLNPEFMRLYAGRLDILLGGHPQDVPDMYELASPVTHVQLGCPSTLLIQGKQDFITPVDATCALHTKLVESGVPAINVVFPWTDHGFDLLLPQVNPAAQSALYDVDRFLALLLN